MNKQKKQDVQVRHLGDEFSTFPGFQFLPSVTEGPRGSKREGANPSPPNRSVSPSFLRGAENAKARDRFGVAAQFMVGMKFEDKFVSWGDGTNKENVFEKTND